MQFTDEEIAGGVDLDTTNKQRTKIALLAALLTSSAIVAAIALKHKLKAPTLH